MNGAHGGVKVASTMEVSIIVRGPRIGKQREEGGEEWKKKGSFNYGLEAPGYESALALICNQHQTALFLTAIWTKPEHCCCCRFVVHNMVWISSCGNGLSFIFTQTLSGCGCSGNLSSHPTTAGICAGNGKTPFFVISLSACLFI